MYLSSLVLCISSCASSGPAVLNYSLRQLPVIDPIELARNAEHALMEEGYTIDRSNKDDSTITTLPMTTIRPNLKLDRRRLVGQKPELRRQAFIRIIQRADSVKIHCKVTLQELVTEMHRFMVLDRQGIDTPTSTPIQREGATTVKQNSVWRTIRRDKLQERRILDAITSSTTP